VQAFIERLVSGSWQTIGQASVNDNSSDRIATAGSVGFGGYIEDSYRYDNFVRVNLGSGGTGNPVPATTAIAPSSALAGESGLTLTVSGSNFVSGSIVRWNNVDRATTFVSTSEVTAAIPPADLASAGTATVAVFNPSPGGGLSNAQNFTINANPTPNPVPGVTGLNPSTVTAGSGAFTLTVNGSNFASTAVVRWNGANRTTTFVSASQLQAQISAADVASAGNVPVTVFNPSPGGGVSNAVTFNVTVPNNPVPATSSLSPTSTTAGSGSFTLTVNGSGFIAASQVRWNGANRTTTFVSSTQIRAAITSSDVSTSGTALVTVFNPTPGGGTSGSQVFSITPSGGGTNPVPVLAQLSPRVLVPGSSAFTLTLTGSNFVPTSIVRWNGSNRTTTYVSSTTLRANIGSGDVASAGLATVTVSNPSPGGGGSAPQTFFTLAGPPTLFTDNFDRADGAAVGNNWTEKNAAAFALSGGRVTSVATPLGYINDIVSRPSGEDRRDVEASVEFVRRNVSTSWPFANYPQVHARAQRDTLTTNNTLESYILFVDDAGSPHRAVIAIQGDNPPFQDCYMRVVNLPTQLALGSRYRLRFRVEGVSPVRLDGAVERFDGQNWVNMVSLSTTHDSSTQRDPNLYCDGGFMPPPILNAGSTGFAKYVSWTDDYDGFHWYETAPGVPQPMISSLNPSAATAGSAGFTLVVNGSGFSNQSGVRWNGAGLSTQYISSGELRATVAASLIVDPAIALVSVFDPGGGGMTSNTSPFQVNAPPGASDFLDGFDRANSAALGNGWIEKSANALAINSGRAIKQAVSTWYRDNIAYRPATENLRDVEASTEFRLNTLPAGYPQLLVRVQTDTAAIANNLDGYILFISDSTNLAELGRQEGTVFETPLSSFTLSPALNATDTYRLRLRAVGTNPVQLAAFVERLNGSNWEIIGQASVNDSSPARIQNAGSVAFGGHTEANYSFDNFRRTALGTQ
jgi:hypothetical protein